MTEAGLGVRSKKAPLTWKGSARRRTAAPTSLDADPQREIDQIPWVNGTSTRRRLKPKISNGFGAAVQTAG